MAESVTSVHHRSTAPNTLSVPWVLLASLLMGAGVLLVSLWIVTFDYVYFAGFAVLVVGFLMVFDRRMGSDHA
ncbi:MAG TPA: hypothetical protein VJQ43_01870 [Thermoplasmata archaeon]|nr:hypothetical protein [Thermoplasmata archaeon]